MEKRPVVDKRSVRLEEVMKSDYIPFLGGRPEREKVIGIEDILNVKINLNVTGSIEEFLKQL